jgi:hypothetical protein
LDDDVIGQRQHQAALTALLKTHYLSGRTTGLETPQNFIARDDREREVTEDG